MREDAMNLSLQRIAQWLPQARLCGDGATCVQRVHTDSRSLQAGDLFVALRGERFDAHRFLPQVAAQGATAVLAEQDIDASGLPGVQVAESRQALGALARGWRLQFELPLIAVTGSNGKTTVTQMVASILRAAHGEAAHFTQGNLNNDIGVPQTLLRLRAHHRASVVELGMNHVGEIAWLADLARPSVALVNNAQREHQEFMGTVEAVAHENGAVIAALPAHGVAVFPAGDPYTPVWQTLAGARRCLRFSLQAGQGEVHLLHAQWQDGAWQMQAATPAGPLATRLHIAGRHNLANALAATAAALAAGVSLADIAAGLDAFRPVQGRSRALSLHCAGRAITVVDDTYNANPDSVRAAIEVLAELPAPQMLVLGDMGEVGEQGPSFHQEVGAHAQARGLAHVLCLGELARHSALACAGAEHFADIEALQARVLALLPQMGSVLVKGSRFMKMERVVQAMADCENTEHEGRHACC